MSTGQWILFVATMSYMPVATRSQSSHLALACLAILLPAAAAGSALLTASAFVAASAVPAPSGQSTRADASSGNANSSQAIRSADFEELMADVLAKQLGGRQKMKEACAAAQKEDPVEIADTIFGDLDGDGNEEAVVTATSCDAGQTPPDLLAVFKREASGTIVALAMENRGDAVRFKDKPHYEDLRGPWQVRIDKGSLVVRYMIWSADAPKCGDADCTEDFVYRWDGHQLALADVVLSPIS
jgi:hypothetical protein